MIVYYTNMINWPLERITQQIQDLQRAGASLIRIMGIQRTQGKISGEDNFSLPEALQLRPGPLSVAFEGVTFGYSDSLSTSPKKVEPAAVDPAPEPDPEEKEMVLCDISFHLKPGQVIGLLGRTGSGKTTLTRLLFRLYDPDQGRIRLGNDGSCWISPSCRSRSCAAKWGW